MTAVTSVAMVSVHVAGMFAIFIHLSKVYNPNKISALIRHQHRLKMLKKSKT